MCWMFFLTAEGFSFTLDILLEAWISELQFYKNFWSSNSWSGSRSGSGSGSAFGFLIDLKCWIWNYEFETLLYRTSLFVDYWICDYHSNVNLLYIVSFYLVGYHGSYGRFGMSERICFRIWPFSLCQIQIPARICLRLRHYSKPRTSYCKSLHNY